MKTVREVLRRAPVWVNPDHTTESAIVLMRGHRVGGLPVMDGHSLVGMVLYSHLLGIDTTVPVRDVMEREVPVLAPAMSVRAAAELMARGALGRLPVVDEGRLIGVITEGDLLPELGRSYDPLTDLPWSDTMREWSIEQLKRGHEITVLFLDIDQFGHFNKLHGHIVGDEVLTAVAAQLVSLVDEQTDSLCRYGGDEFCIATLRPADEAEQLGALASSRIAAVDVPSLRGEHISCTVGQFGGKRTKEREHTHYAATLNSLINLASRDCTAHKEGVDTSVGTHAVVTTGHARPKRLRLARIEVTWAGRLARVQVDLEGEPSADAGTRGQPGYAARYSASGSREADEGGTPRLVADTTASAISSALPEGSGIAVDDVIVNDTAERRAVVTVLVQLTIDRQRSSLAGSAVVAGDQHRAVAAAVLDAVNRPLSAVLART